MTTIRKRTRARPPSRTYDVGYKKPPRDSQWQAGQSGNFNGRPRRSLALNPILERSLRKKVSVTRNSGASSIEILEAIVEKLTLDAAKGDNAARKLVLQLNEQREAAFAEAQRASEVSADDQDLEPIELTILELYKEKILREAGLPVSSQPRALSPTPTAMKGKSK